MTLLILLTGRENDGTGLYYYRARFYHTQLQRFISEDPIGFGSGDFNLYTYVYNNPFLFVDPFGLCGKNCEQPPGSGGGSGSKNKSKPPPPIPPCQTMDCTPKPPSPEPPCRTPGECFPSFQGSGEKPPEDPQRTDFRDAMEEWQRNKEKWDRDNPGLTDMIDKAGEFMRNTQPQSPSDIPSGGKGGGSNSGGRLGKRPPF